MALFGLIPYSLPNDVLFVIVSLAVVYLLIEDLITGDGKNQPKESNSGNQSGNTTYTIEDAKRSRRRRRGRYGKPLPPQAYVLLAPPVYSGSTVRRVIHMNLCAFSRYIPANCLTDPVCENEPTINTIKYVPPPTVPSSSPSSPEKGSGGGRESVALSPAAMAAAGENGTAPTPSPSGRQSVSMTGASSRASISAPAPTLSDYDICKKVIFPFMPGCDPNGPEVAALLKRFPGQLSRPDCVRFLVARKGNLEAATEMAEKCLAWRSKSFPVKKSYVASAFGAKCFFPYGVAKDGTPIVFMRGAFYDCEVATPEQYVLAAAYTIDWSLKQYPDQTSVTVIVHGALIPGAPNQSADTTFIKLFMQVREKEHSVSAFTFVNISFYCVGIE